MAAVAPLVADPLVRTRGTLVGSLCHADPQGDWASVVTALDGHVVAQGANGRRTISIKDFVSGPFQTTLSPDEIAVEAVIPAPVGTPAGGYLKLERRVGDFATAGVAVALETSGANVTKAGIALTGVGGSTIDASAAAESLVGGAADRRRHRTGRRPGRRGRPTVQRPPGQRRVQAPHRAHVRGPAARPASPSPKRRRPDMTSLFTEISPEPESGVSTRRVTITVNGERRAAEIEPRLLLAHLLRQGLGLTGTHIGCDTTNCGACTVLYDGVPVKSCTMLAVQADGHEVTTVEGLATRQRAAAPSRRASSRSTASSAGSARRG